MKVPNATIPMEGYLVIVKVSNTLIHFDPVIPLLEIHPINIPACEGNDIYIASHGGSDL